MQVPLNGPLRWELLLTEEQALEQSSWEPLPPPFQLSELSGAGRNGSLRVKAADMKGLCGAIHKEPQGAASEPLKLLFEKAE